MKRLIALSLVALFVAVPLFAQVPYRATLSWTDNSDNEDGFRVERRLDPMSSDGWTVLGTVASNVISFVDEPILQGQSFCWRVIAFNVAGDSLPSNEACGAVSTTPVAPGGLQVIISQAP
jgi:hypothetical protein